MSILCLTAYGINGNSRKNETAPRRRFRFLSISAVSSPLSNEENTGNIVWNEGNKRLKIIIQCLADIQSLCDNKARCQRSLYHRNMPPSLRYHSDRQYFGEHEKFGRILNSFFQYLNGGLRSRISPPCLFRSVS